MYTVPDDRNYVRFYVGKRKGKVNSALSARQKCVQGESYPRKNNKEKERKGKVEVDKMSSAKRDPSQWVSLPLFFLFNNLLKS